MWFFDALASLTLFPELPPYVRQREAPEYEGPEADACAIAGDWQRVGDDMRKAMIRVAKEVAEIRNAKR